MRPPLRKALLWATVGAVLLAAGGAALVLTVGREPVERLREGREARERAARNVERIVENLRGIAAELEGAAGLEGRSDEIHELTAAQRRSVEDLIGLLESQLRALARTSAAAERTRESTAEIAELSTEQARRLREAVEGLRRLRGLAEGAGRTSSELARLALYGARLAEDAQESFTE